MLLVSHPQFPAMQHNVHGEEKPLLTTPTGEGVVIGVQRTEAETRAMLEKFLVLADGSESQQSRASHAAAMLAEIIHS